MQHRSESGVVLTSVSPSATPPRRTLAQTATVPAGETSDELAGLATSMRSKALTVDTPYDVVDIVGTGGDGIGSVNISTGACVIAAAAGARVAKHGNRSVSSLCGSADVLEVRTRLLIAASSSRVGLPRGPHPDHFPRSRLVLMFQPLPWLVHRHSPQLNYA